MKRKFGDVISGSVEEYRRRYGDKCEIELGETMQTGGDKEEMNEVDLLLLMDCTGSKGSWIRQAQNDLINIIDAVKKKTM